MLPALCPVFADPWQRDGHLCFPVGDVDCHVAAVPVDQKGDDGVTEADGRVVVLRDGALGQHRDLLVGGWVAVVGHGHACGRAVRSRRDVEVWRSVGVAVDRDRR